MNVFDFDIFPEELIDDAEIFYTQAEKFRYTLSTN